MRKSTAFFSALLVSALIAGCATRGDVDQINNRLDALDGKLSTMSESLTEVAGMAELAEEQATSAALTAREAAAHAEAAEYRSNQAARTSEAIFDKSVTK